MKVGVYIDGFNLYYGGRALFGRGTPGWRWLDLRQLSQRLLDRRPDWLKRGAVIERIVYCTAFIDGQHDRQARLDQDAYVRALQDHRSIDHLEQGRFSARVRKGLLATKDRAGHPSVVASHWPVVIQNEQGADVPNARFMVSYLRMEEKGSDVNVASHLLLDVLGGRVDAAIAISNDSDLRLPIQACRERAPTGTVNPSPSPRAGDLRGEPTDGVGGHWWYRLSEADFTACQLSKKVGSVHRPRGW